MLDVSPTRENTCHETSHLAPRSQRDENPQAGVPGSDGARGALGCVGRTHCPLLPRRQDWQASLFVDEHASHPLHAMVHFVCPAMKEAFFDTPLYREFAQLQEFGRLPDESTILRFRQRLDKHKLADQILSVTNELLTKKGLLLKAGTAINATLIAAHTSTKNKDKKRDPEMHSSKKGNQWYFDMKAHIGMDAESGLVHTVRGSSGHVSDIAEANILLHGEENVAFGDAGYQGFEKRPDATKDVTWHVAMRPGKRKALNKDNAADAMIHRVEKLKAGIRAKVEHPFRVIKRQFGHVKVRYRSLKKSTAQLVTLFALSNLWMARGKLMGAQA